MIGMTIKCEVADYQPGTGTRYILIHGIVGEEDAAKIGCSAGALFLGYKDHGSYVFTEGAVPSYVAEKLGIESFMLDAIAIVQFIRAKFGKPLIEDNFGGVRVEWSICEKCGLPQISPRKCICRSW